MSAYLAHSKQTTCPYCGVGCGLEVDLLSKRSADTLHVESVEAKSLKGASTHPANAGKLCIKGTHLLETLDSNTRLARPNVNGQDCSWDEASDEVASRMQQCIKTYGPDSVAFYVSGQLLTEDYYVANKLMKGFVGSGNIDTNSRLCMSSAVAAYKRAFGADAVPCSYDDLDSTDLLVLVGSNAAWTHPVLFQRMEKAKLENPNMQVVLIDPRQTASTSLADIHLQIKPGSDTSLFNGLLQFMQSFSSLQGKGGLDKEFIDKYCDNFEAAISVTSKFTLAQVTHNCQVSERDLISFYRAFCESQTTVTFYSMGVNQSVSGVDNANAIINCHLASGKIGKKGCGPFSITGQPNAMGGREVGGLANMLAAHMDIENKVHHDVVSRFWKSNSVTTSQGLKAVDMFEAIERGQIKFIWIMATNPVVSMPDRNKIEAALTKCETVVVSDCVAKNDTLNFAHIKLPASAWSEKDGTVTNSERCISRQRQLFPVFKDAKHDWQIICEVARKMGFSEHFAFNSPVEIFKEHCELTAFENTGSRMLDLSGLCNITPQEYEDFRPIQWPVNELAPNGTKRLFSDKRFYTKNQRAHFVPIHCRLPEQQVSVEFPFVLNTGRSRDHWHTMTRTGSAPRLHEHSPQCQLFIHPDDATKLQLGDGDLVEIHSQQNKAQAVILPIKKSDLQKAGELFAPIHWSKTWSSHVNLTALFSNARDKISGQPELKHAAVSVQKIKTTMSANFYSSSELNAMQLKSISDYWTITKLKTGYCYHLALFAATKTTKTIAQTPQQWVDIVMASSSKQKDIIRYSSPAMLSAIRISENKLTQCVFIQVSSQPVYVPQEAQWVASMMLKDDIELNDSDSLLRRTPSHEYTKGPLVCSCFCVHENTIVEAITKGASSVKALGDSIKCGTNCGSCKSELAVLIEQHQPQVLIPILELEA